MVRITQSEKNNIVTIDDECIVLFREIIPYWKDQHWDEFPLLQHDVYEWSKKNKCAYLRSWYLPEGRINFSRALLFKDSKKAKQFRDKWIEPLLFISKGTYEFTDQKRSWYPANKLLSDYTMTKWLKKNKIEITTRKGNWILFNSTKDLLLFKMRWIC